MIETPGCNYVVNSTSTSVTFSNTTTLIQGQLFKESVWQFRLAINMMSPAHRRARSPFCRIHHCRPCPRHRHHIDNYLYGSIKCISLCSFHLSQPVFMIDLVVTIKRYNEWLRQQFLWFHVFFIKTFKVGPLHHL